MAQPEVWISTTTAAIGSDAAGPGDQWQRVGTIDTSCESDLWKHIQVLLGHRRSAPRVHGFYLSGDPHSAWVQAARDEPAGQPPFWIAIDPFGEIRSTMAAGADNHRFFVSTEKATLGALARRAPEHHPGMTKRPVFAAIRLHRNDVGIFAPPPKPR
jgi:hypothetical protein